MNEPLISIAMATYNGEKYLKEQLDSIYAQTYKNIEVIVTDDCSPDKTVDILEQYSKSHGLRYFVNEQNLGFVKNFEKVLSLCNGDYIALADQDDIWCKDKIEILLKNISGHLMVHSDAILIDDKGKMIEESFTKQSKKKIYQTTQEYLFINNLTGCTSMIDKTLLRKALPIPSQFGVHDYWLAVIASTQGSIAYVDKPLVKYRQHSNNQIGAFENTSNSSLKDFVKKIMKEGVCNEKMMKSREKKRLKFEVLDQYKYLFEKREQNTIADMKLYYQEFFSKKVSWKSFFIHLKYFSLMQPKKTFLVNLKALIYSLIGCRKN